MGICSVLSRRGMSRKGKTKEFISSLDRARLLIARSAAGITRLKHDM